MSWQKARLKNFIILKVMYTIFLNVGIQFKATGCKNECVYIKHVDDLYIYKVFNNNNNTKNNVIL